MQNSMVVFTFSVSDRKHPFWANLVQKIKIASLGCNLVPRLVQICRIQWWRSLFLFQAGNTLSGQIWFKKSKLLVQVVIQFLDQFKCAEFNGGVHFFCFRLETSFLGKFGPKNQTCQFKLKFDTLTISNMQNSMVLFTFSVLDRKHTFKANLVQKIKLSV